MIEWDSASSIQDEFSDLLAPDLQIMGSHDQLADIHSKLLAVKKVIGRNEINFVLTCCMPPLVGWTATIGGVSIDEVVTPTADSRIKLSALSKIIGMINGIMHGEQP